MRFRKVFLERRGFRVSTVRAEATNAYSRIMHSATVRGVHQPSVSNELNCTGKRAGVREWKGRPCLSSVARVPRAGSPAACLHVTPGGPTYHVLRVHTHTHTHAHRAHENRLARATGPAVELSRSGLRGVAVLAPDYDLPTVLFLTFFFSFSSLSFDANSEKWRTFEEKGKKRGRDCLLGFDFSKRCNLDKKR